MYARTHSSKAEHANGWLARSLCWPLPTRLPRHCPADAFRVLSVLRRCPVPCIALAMGERGQITRLLAPKYGGFLTFGALSPDRASGGQAHQHEECCELLFVGPQGSRVAAGSRKQE